MAANSPSGCSADLSPGRSGTRSGSASRDTVGDGGTDETLPRESSSPTTASVGLPILAGGPEEEVNRSEKKIGADEMPAVTQLFTEDYMVLFLLHNTLGAWWAGKVLAQPDTGRVCAKRR